MPRKRVTHEVDDFVIEGNAQSPEMSTFAKTLNSLLIEKGVHQGDMAKALGISTGSISSYRNGKKEPRLSVIIGIANFLGVDCHYLLTGVQANNYVCSNELGLSEKAINAIKELGTIGIDVLNPILEYKLLFWILDDINRLALEESTRKYAETDEKKAMNNGDIQDFTEKMTVKGTAEKGRDVLEYRILKKFKNMLDTVVSNLVLRKDFRVYGAKMAELGYWNEAKFYNELQKDLDAEKEGENSGEH